MITNLLKINISEVIEYLKKQRNIKTVILQAPDGLRNQLLELAKIIRSNLNINVYISGNRCYGSCDLPYNEARLVNADLVLHFGHIEYPHSPDQFKLIANFRVKYFPIYFDKQVDDNILKKLLRFLREREIHKVMILYSIQYKPQAEQIRAILRNKGFHILNSIKDGFIVGCLDINNKIKDLDCILVISAGLFHALGVAIKTGYPTLLIDIHSNRIIDMTKYAKKYRIILADRVNRFKNAQRIGIIISSKSGQFNIKTALYIRDELEKLGKDPYLIIIDEITPDNLSYFIDIDAFIQTGCPRISIDDQVNFRKPILNFEQFLVFLQKRSFEEIYPWRKELHIQEKK